MIYGIMFSIVLLNTDLHVANVGSNQGKKMTRRAYVKNTLDNVEIMVSADPLTKVEITLLSVEARKAWKRDMETQLKVILCYCCIPLSLTLHSVENV